MSDTAHIRQVLDELKSQFTGTAEDLKSLVKTQAAEIKAHGQTTTETAAKITAAEKKLGQAIDEVKGVTGQLEEKFGTLEGELKESREQLAEAVDRLDEFEKKSQRPGWSEGTDERKSIGELFIESEEYKSWHGTNAKQSTPFKVPGLFPAWVKAGLTTSSAERLVPPERDDMVSPPMRRLFVRNLMPNRKTERNEIEYVEKVGFAPEGAPSGTFTWGAAGATAEGSALPQAQIELALRTASMKWVGHALPISRQAADDAPQVVADIEDDLIYGVPFEEELMALYGDGVGENFQGIMTHPNRQQYAWSQGKEGDTLIDALRRAATLAYQREHFPTGYVINPTNWEDVQLAKGDNGHYIWLVVSAGTDESFFRVPIVITNAIQPGEALVGSWALGATLWDRQETQIRISDEYQDFSVRNMRMLIAEERVTVAWKRPDAFVAIDFDNPPPAAP